MLRVLSVACLMLAFAPAQDRAAASKPAVEVPTFANATCPIMGKPVSMPLFVDTELGRIHVCCKPCNKKVLADVQAAHQTAYPVVQELANTACPVSGEPIGDDAVEVTLQGYKLKLCCSGCLATARTHSQLTLLKATRPKIADAGNDTCPVTGKPVAANALVIVDGTIVHLADPKVADDVVKDPDAALAKAKAIAKAQPPRPKHEHVKKAEQKDATDKAGGR